MNDVVFVSSTSSCSLRREVNGTMLLATKLLQAGFNVKVIRLGQIESYGKNYSQFIKDIVEQILDMEPKSVSFYSISIDYHIMLRIAHEIKERNADIITVFGGPQASTTARDTMNAFSYVDYLCSGEGEETVIPFFKTILEENGANLSTIPGLYYRKDGVVTFHNLELPLCDLNTLPHWDERLLMGDPEPNIQSDTYYMPIDAGRGCPYSCTFCCTSQFWRRIYRLKSPERIVEDIKFFNEKFGIRSFNFTHDAFVTNKKLVEQVCDHLLENNINIKWRCSARVDCLSEDLILKMKSAGLALVELGIETGSPRMQKLINKNLNLDRAKRMVKFLVDNGIRVYVFFMYGFPEETESELNETLELAFSLVDMGIASQSMTFCRFCPVTAMTQEHYDKLVFDPDIKILSRDVFGYDDELDIIKQNKAIFPFYYHLNTPVRNEYQYIHYLLELYLKFPRAIKRLRKLYHGDNLKLYRDFIQSNLSCFEGNMDELSEHIQQRPLEMVLNTADCLDVPYLRQLKACLKYAYHIQMVNDSEDDITITETYDFNYVDINMKRPIEQFSNGKTTMLLKKEAGIVSVNVLNIEWSE